MKIGSIFHLATVSKTEKFKLHFNYKIIFYTLQNHFSIALFTICVYECLMDIIISLQCSKAEVWTPNSEYLNVHYKSQKVTQAWQY